eukprot:4906850-Alexandrium_andersonii.AAC.1
MDASVAHESEGFSRFATSRSVYEEYTGDELPARLVRKAREEEVAVMEDWGVWEVITRKEAHRLTGKAPSRVGGSTAIRATVGVPP